MIVVNSGTGNYLHVIFTCSAALILAVGFLVYKKIKNKDKAEVIKSQTININALKKSRVSIANSGFKP